MSRQSHSRTEGLFAKRSTDFVEATVSIERLERRPIVRAASRQKTPQPATPASRCAIAHRKASRKDRTPDAKFLGHRRPLVHRSERDLQVGVGSQCVHLPCTRRRRHPASVQRSLPARWMRQPTERLSGRVHARRDQRVRWRTGGGRPFTRGAAGLCGAHDHTRHTIRMSAYVLNPTTNLQRAQTRRNVHAVKSLEGARGAWRWSRACRAERACSRCSSGEAGGVPLSRSERSRSLRRFS